MTKKGHDMIVCLVGESGSGKTTIAKELEERGYNVIQAYTTRPPREENEWGHTFVTFYEPEGEEVIARKELYGYTYWATKEQYQGGGISIYVVDPEGAQMAKENVDDACVVVIYLRVGYAIRLMRLIGRNSRLQHPHRPPPGAALGRIQADEDIFRVVACDYVVDGEMLPEKVAEEIENLIPLVGEGRY